MSLKSTKIYCQEKYGSLYFHNHLWYFQSFVTFNFWIRFFTILKLSPTNNFFLLKRWSGALQVNRLFLALFFHSIDANAAAAITNNNWVSDDDTSILLYNIRLDPLERVNLVNVRTDVALELLYKLAVYQNSSFPLMDPKNDRR